MLKNYDVYTQHAISLLTYIEEFVFDENETAFYRTVIDLLYIWSP